MHARARATSGSVTRAIQTAGSIGLYAAQRFVRDIGGDIRCRIPSRKLAMSKEILFISRSQPRSAPALARFNGMAGPAAQLADDSRRRGGDIDLHFHGFMMISVCPSVTRSPRATLTFQTLAPEGAHTGGDPVGEDSHRLAPRSRILRDIESSPSSRQRCRSISKACCWRCLEFAISPEEQQESADARERE